MKNATSACNDQRLHQLLAADLGDAAFLAASEHLEACAYCQSRLAALAADPDQWIEAKRSLTLDATDSQIEREEEERSWRAPDDRLPPKTWTDSMSSQLLSPPSHPEMLGRLGRFEIERLIGAGGMGVVFKGFDSELNRPVAIKVLAPHLAGSGAARQRFAREARAAAAVVHEHVVAIHNVESESEPPFLVMQYVPGDSLQTRIDREGPLGVCEVLRIARQTAAALAAAHEQGLVHRDVKPSNILLEQGVERALLTDFGLARAGDDASLTRSGHVPGTPDYMSPEQARGERADQRSDLFSLGSVMYAMCTARSPFRAETSYGVLRRITDSQPRPIREVQPEFPLWLWRIIEKLHAKVPADRYESAAQVAELLAQCLAHVQQPDVQPLPRMLAEGIRSRPSWHLIRKTPRAVLAVLATVLVVIAVTLMIVQRRQDQVDLTVPPVARSDAPLAATEPDPINRAAPTRSHDPDPAINWDATENGIRQLTLQNDELTSRIQRLWDDVPTATPTETTLPPFEADPSPRKESVP